MLEGNFPAKSAAKPQVPAQRRRGPRPAFTREDILRAALDILERAGHESLSFRAVAAALKTSHQALYNYFDNLADLEDEIAARLIADVRPLSGAGGLPLREQLVRFGLDLIHKFSLHPYLRQISGASCADIAGRLHNQNIRVLVAAGIEPQRAHFCQLVLQLAASGLGIELHRSQAIARPALKKMSAAYLKELGRGLPGAHGRKALIKVAASSRAGNRATMEMLVDAHLPELKRRRERGRENSRRAEHGKRGRENSRGALIGGATR